MVLTIYFKVHANSARDMVNQIELYHYNIVMNDLGNYQRVIKKGTHLFSEYVCNIWGANNFIDFLC